MIKLYQHPWLHTQIYIINSTEALGHCSQQPVRRVSSMSINTLMNVETMMYAMEFYLTIEKKSCKMSFVVKLVK